MEQLSNAEALRTLGFATTVNDLSTAAIEHWLGERQPAESMQYPDVAKRIVEWLTNGQQESAEMLSRQLWQSVSLPDYQAAIQPG